MLTLNQVLDLRRDLCLETKTKIKTLTPGLRTKAKTLVLGLETKSRPIETGLQCPRD